MSIEYDRTNNNQLPPMKTTRLDRYREYHILKPTNCQRLIDYRSQVEVGAADVDTKFREHTAHVIYLKSRIYFDTK